jgi:hypothetical protein
MILAELFNSTWLLKNPHIIKFVTARIYFIQPTHLLIVVYSSTLDFKFATQTQENVRLRNTSRVAATNVLQLFSLFGQHRIYQEYIL